MTARVVGFVLALVVALVLVEREAEACSCGESPGVAATLDGKGAVFVGVLVAESEIERDPTRRDAPTLDFDPTRYIASYFEVVRVFEGDFAPGDRVRVLTEGAGSSCAMHGYGTLGGSWLIFASGEGTHLHDRFCSGSRHVSHARRDLRELERLVPSTEPPALRGGCALARAGEGERVSTMFVLALVLVRRRRR